ncbi:MAG: hypothetical protein HZB24_13550 [Desulfobacterales bacterium]|nr:hypothetical protein [Desulfobacterales bacterium]
MADAGPHQTVTEGVIVTLNASNAKDRDDGTAALTRRQIAGPAVKT